MFSERRSAQVLSDSDLVPPETFSRNKTISHDHFVPLNRFIRNKTINHDQIVPLKTFLQNDIYCSDLRAILDSGTSALDVRKIIPQKH